MQTDRSGGITPPLTDRLRYCKKCGFVFQLMAAKSKCPGDHPRTNYTKKVPPGVDTTPVTASKDNQQPAAETNPPPVPQDIVAAVNTTGAGSGGGAAETQRYCKRCQVVFDYNGPSSRCPGGHPNFAYRCATAIAARALPFPVSPCLDFVCCQTE